MRCQFFMSVEIILLNQDQEVFLLQRQNTGHGDGYYSLPCGHVEPSEGVLGAAIREAYEEMGVVIERNDLEHACVMYRKSRPGTPQAREYIDHFFICRRWANTPYNAEPHKAAEAAFFKLDKLPMPFLPYVMKGMEHALSGCHFLEYEDP